MSIVTGLSTSAKMVLDTIEQRPTRGIPVWIIHVMEHAMIERLAGAAPGEYRRDPKRVYLAMERAMGVCCIDQFIPENPLTMGQAGYEQQANKTATQGAEQIIVDGITINSPEAVVEHMEKFVFPGIQSKIAAFDEESRVREIIEREQAVQMELGPDILKTGYTFVSFPKFSYGCYGYENYFMAYACYPEVIEQHFKLQADLALLNNRAAAAAYVRANLPPMHRLDHDMADSRGTLVSIDSLDRSWFPHFARCLDPLLKTNVRLIWHCDGNLMKMIPRLLEVGIRGFQGFQYEDGMDYLAICRMKSRDGEPLLIIGGVSVTRTLPQGTPDDVRRELAWLVEHGPKTGLMLACTSSIAPGVPWENLHALAEGLNHYRQCGR